MASDTMVGIEVERQNWASTRIVREALSQSLEDCELLLKVERFGLSANNISYCVGGDRLGYWGFFPSASGWGRIPCMAYAKVIASAHPAIAVGERVWGFVPMFSHLKVKAGDVTAGYFIDKSEHRTQYSPRYAQFQRVAASRHYKPEREDQDILLRGLYMAGWMCEDFMFDHQAFGADAYLITSASSKTSIAMAYAVKDRADKATIGLTSPCNMGFCESVGCFDEVVSYAELDRLNRQQKIVLVDMAGNADLLGRVHRYYNDNLMYSCRVGATHYSDTGTTQNLPGPTPVFFFAPGQAQQRISEWGEAEFDHRLASGFERFSTFSDSWLKVVRRFGIEQVIRQYQQLLAGECAPNEGYVLSLWEQP